MSNKKIIKIEIDSNTFPMLFNIKPDQLGNICYNIFECGYKNYFPSSNQPEVKTNNLVVAQNEKVIKSMDYHTDSIKYELNTIQDKLKDIDIDKKLDKFSVIIEDLLGISSSSAKKGQISENMVYTMLRNKFKDYAIEETRHNSHTGDGRIDIPYDNKIVKVMIEIKNYAKTVDNDEIEKLLYDMKHTGIKYSLFISLKSGIVGKKQMAIQEFNYHGEKYTVVYIPNVFGEFSKIESSVLIIERLIDYHMKNLNKNVEIKWLGERINEHLMELDNIYSDFNNLKQKYHKMETSIKQNLNDYYISIRSFECELKTKINTIWKSVGHDFGNAEKELIASESIDKIINELNNNKITPVYKLLIKVFELLKKYGYMVKMSCKDTWYIANTKNKKEINGTICKLLNNTIQVMFMNPNFSVLLDHKHHMSNDMNMVEKMLMMVD